MSTFLYRLFAIQTFEGKKVGVYICEGNFPKAEILSDASEIVDGHNNRIKIINEKKWFYGIKKNISSEEQLNRKELQRYTGILQRGQKIISENKNIDMAVFLPSTNRVEWRGEQDLYHNNIFDIIKCNTPEYTGCNRIGTIII